jgi:hypothetical protein
VKKKEIILSPRPENPNLCLCKLIIDHGSRGFEEAMIAYNFSKDGKGNYFQAKEEAYHRLNIGRIIYWLSEHNGVQGAFIMSESVGCNRCGHWNRVMRKVANNKHYCEVCVKELHELQEEFNHDEKQ